MKTSKEVYADDPVNALKNAVDGFKASRTPQTGVSATLGKEPGRVMDVSQYPTE